MGEPFITDYIEKLSLLERRAGASVNYRMLDPFPINSRDITDINKATKKIANFVGIRDVINVAVSKQVEGTGGNIEIMHGGANSFIEISPDVAKFEQATLATLAHEISHKYLHSYNISWGTQLADRHHNEVLTDICGVFLGLGKLMLNGVVCETTRERYDSGSEQTIRETFTLKVGYLDEDQLTFVYCLVCAMRKIPPAQFLSGLNERAGRCVSKCDFRFQKEFFDPWFHDADWLLRQTGGLETDLRIAEASLCDTQAELAGFEKAYLEPARSAMQRAVTALDGFRQGLASFVAPENYDPALRFLERIGTWQKISRIRSDLRKSVLEAEAGFHSIRSLLRPQQCLDTRSRPPKREGGWIQKLARVFGTKS